MTTSTLTLTARTLSVLLVTAAIALVVYGSVGAVDSIDAPGQSTVAVASASESSDSSAQSTQTCPRTGCAASSCHGGTDPGTFYGSEESGLADDLDSSFPGHRGHSRRTR